jgi:hypothetical protein
MKSKSLLNFIDDTIWHDVVGYEGLYQVNDQGQVARIGGNVLKPYQGQVYLSKGGKVATIRVCNIVANAFIPEYSAGQKVYHISGDSDALSNLSLTLPVEDTNSDWKDIPGYEGFYQASTDGKIRSCTRYNEKSKAARYGNELKLHVGDDGYVHCMLSAHGVSKLHSVHRLVASAHIPNPENKPQVNHIDGDKLNNSVANLEWVTREENMNHAKAMGLWDPQKCGNIEMIKHGKPVRCITDGKTYRSISEAARTYNMDFESVKESIQLNRCRKGLMFEYVTEEDSHGC